jgi:pimeloyl-ACP methyl ester carboxylesterase
MNTTAAANTFSSDGRETVICLHGSTASGRQWQPLSDRLGSRFTVHAPDLYGYGSAPEWHGRSHFTLDDELERIAPRIEQAEKGVHLVGHSYGGAVALKAAVRYPKQVLSVAVYEPVLFRLLFRQPATSEAVREIWTTQRDVRRSLSAGHPLQAAERFVDYWNGNGAWEWLTARQQASVSRRIGKVRLDFDALFSDTTVIEDLASLPMALLCLYGSRAPLASRSIARLIGSRSPRASLVRMEGLGHMGPVTGHQRVNDRLMVHLKRQATYARARRASRSATVALPVQDELQRKGA